MSEEYSMEFTKEDELLERIAELEKENAELKEELTKKADTNHSLVEQMADLEMGIALKDEEIGCIETDFNTFKSKAKEIIKDFLLMAEVEHLKDRYETVDEAEQFLSEVEK